MSRPVRLGLLTPSSNTVLELLSTAMVAGLPGVSLHFSRFRVTEIALSDAALAQFDPAPVLHAAALLVGSASTGMPSSAERSRTRRASLPHRAFLR